MSDLKKEVKEIKNDLKLLENLSEKKILNMLEFLSDKYYNESKSLITDEVFDYIKEYYENKFNKKLPVGSKIKKSSNKVILPYYMGSLDKIKPSMKEFDKWLNKYSGPYSISYKLDGMSILITKENNKISMYRRGDSREAEDITRFINYVKINTSNLVNGDAIRGEAVISKKNFEKVKKILERQKKDDKSKQNRKYKQSRNVVSGLFNNKTPNEELLKYVDIVCYWVLSPQMKIVGQLKYLKEKKIKIVEYETKKNLTTKFLSEMLLKGRLEYEYQIDGLVIVDNSEIYVQKNENPQYAFSFKQVMTDQIMESMVVDVKWEITKDKYLKPTVVIEPIELLDCDITKATANNAKYIYDNKINVGTVVQIIKANDIIPNIKKVVKASDLNKPKMPSSKYKYKWSKSGVDLIATELDEKNKNKVIAKKLLIFMDIFKIKELGEDTLLKIIKEGYDDIFKILKANKKDLYEIEGLGETSVKKIFKNLDEGLKDKQLYELMTASQLLGRGIANKKFKVITKNYPNILSIYEEKGKSYTKKILNNLEGFSDITIDKIVDGFPEFINYHKKILKIKPDLIKKDNTKDKKNKENNKDNNKDNENKLKNKKLEKYKNKTIVFTGFRDKEIENELEKIDAKVTTSISKNTDFLVAVNITEKSNKIEKAKELKVKILSKEEFYKSIE